MNLKIHSKVTFLDAGLITEITCDECKYTEEKYTWQPCYPCAKCQMISGPHGPIFDLVTVHLNKIT